MENISLPRTREAETVVFSEQAGTLVGISQSNIFLGLVGNPVNANITQTLNTGHTIYLTIIQTDNLSGPDFSFPNFVSRGTSLEQLPKGCSRSNGRAGR